MLLGLFCVGMANAQWTEPVEPTTASDPVSGHAYRVKNVEAEMFLAGGSSWYTWATSAILVDAEASEPLTFTLTETFDEEGTSTGWTFARTTDGKFTFISGAKDGKGEMHVDMASQGHNYFELLKQENGNYHIRAVASDEAYGSAMEGYEEKCWGWEGWESEYQFAVYATLVPGDAAFCDWQFIDFSVYNAQVELFGLTQTIEEEDLGVDYAPYEEAYNSGNLDQLNAAIAELKALIAQARVYAVLRYGEDGMNPPSQDNPADATSLIENNDFSAGNINGWTCTFVSGQNASNVGYQGASYTNGDVTISQFIEAWTPNQMNPNCSWAAIGDGELSQTMPGLPAGLYKLTVDCIAVAQWGNPNPVTGVQLFATGGDIDRYQEIATGDALPEHFEVTFVSSGGDVKLGLRTVNATANWIAADNFTLTYYGEVEDDVNKVILDSRIAELEAQYPDLDAVKANQSVIAAYQAALEAAKAETEDYEGALATLNVAAEALAVSIQDYKTIKIYLDELSEKMAQLEVQWPDLVNDLGDLYNKLSEAYEEGTAATEDITSTQEQVSQAIANYISENCKAGDDITILLTNPSFDTGNFNGWTKTGTVTNVQGADFQAENTSGAMADQAEEAKTWGKDCETYMAPFDLSQTLKNMPAGVFKFTCQGFWRAENSNAVPGELYAVLNGDTENEQVDNLANVNDYATEEALYTSGNWYDDKTNDEGLWIPNGMVGALYHFHHYTGDNDFYDYTSTLNIILTDPADITVGVRQKGGDAWVIFDNFTITYMGQDFSEFKKVVDDLIEKADKIGTGDEDIMTAEAANKITEAINMGEAATDAETCRAAIQALREAIAFGEATLKLTAQLYNEYIIMVDYRAALVSDNYSGLSELLEEIGGYVEDAEFETNAQVEQYRIDMKREYVKGVQFDYIETATEENPADISLAIIGGNGYEYVGAETPSVNGWTVEGGAGLYESQTADGSLLANVEFFNQAFDLRQTIYGLAPGYYVLGVQGFYRDGLPANVEAILANDSVPANNVALFAGEAKTALLPLTEEDDLAAYNEAYQEGAQITIADATVYLPNSMAQASNAFLNDLYQNKLLFQVAEGQESVVIGLSKSELIDNDWTMFGNWTLNYLGTQQPTVDPTTDIQSVDAVAPAAAVIYNLAGQRVQKAVRGLYIVNGRKVLVK